MVADLGCQLVDLFERTGVRAFAMFSRSHIQDMAVPHIVDSDNARAFFQQTFGKSHMQFLMKFEQWSCNVEKGVFLRVLLEDED